MKRPMVMSALFVLTVSVFGGACAQGNGYHIVDSLVLGGEGAWDYLTVEPSSNRLFVSRGVRVQVVDLETNSLAGELPNTPGVHGIATAASLGKGFTSNGRDSSVGVFELKSLTPDATIHIGARNPDAILYDSFTRRVFTFNGGSGNATAIDAENNTVIGAVALGGKPEFAVTDGEGTIFVNIEDKSEMVAIDARSLKVMKRWSLAPGEEPSGLAIDRQHRRLFSGCRNRTLVISDAAAGKVLGTVPIGGGVDAVAFDPDSKLVFSSNGEGTITVIREESPSKFTVVANAITRRGARTMALDESTHRLYTVTAKFGPPPPATAERPHPRPTIEPGSVTLYTLSR